MRWNPAISSYKLDVFHRNCKDYPDGFRIDWSIWEYEPAKCGDRFVMMRVGDHKPGIVFYGTLMSDPYVDDDWAGTDKKRHYVLIDCFGFNENDEPVITAEALQSAIPEIDWMHGHSGQLLSDDVACRLTEMLYSIVPDFSYYPDWELEEDEDEDDSEEPDR